MMLGGGKVGSTQLLSRKSVELMTHDQLGKIGPEQGFGLGLRASMAHNKSAAPRTLGIRRGDLFLGRIFLHRLFTSIPKEQMIVIFMAQLHPTGGLYLGQAGFPVLAYQAIVD